MAKNCSSFLKNFRNGAFEINSTGNQETKDRWATEKQGTKYGGPKAELLQWWTEEGIPAKDKVSGKWDGLFIHHNHPWQAGHPCFGDWNPGASCLNVRYSVVLIALVLKWIQDKKSRESKRVSFFVTWRSVICKWIRVGIVYQKGLFIWNGLLAKFTKMDKQETKLGLRENWNLGSFLKSSISSGEFICM